MKNKKFRLILSACAIMMVAVVIACAVYVNDYYRAGDLAISALNGNDFYHVETTDKYIAFIPDSSATGLIFYPGGKVEYTAYAPLMSELAENGVLCVLIEMPFNLAVLNMNAADGIHEIFPDVDYWYIGGHSLGGAMAASYASKHPDEYEGVILLGAYSTADLNHSGLNVVSIYGSADGVMNREKYAKYQTNLPDDSTEVIIEGGCHSYFGDYGLQKGDGEPGISMMEQIGLTVDATLTMMQ